MIERSFRSIYQRYCVDPLVPYLTALKPAHITLGSCAIGLSIVPLLYFGFPIAAFFLLLLSGFLDTLDGSVARFRACTSPQGAALDITCDRIVEFAIIVGLYICDPQNRAFPSLLMLGSILICVTTFLVVAIFAENDSQKSFHYSPGLIERPEAFLFFGFMILLPNIFIGAAYLFSALTIFTAYVRLHEFMKRSKAVC